MTRGKAILATAALTLVGISGCCMPQGQGLFARWKNRGANGEANCPCPPYMNGYGMEGYGAAGVPVSMPGGMGCPCTTMPSTTMPGGMPGMMPGGQDFMPQPLPNGGFPIMPPPGQVMPPGNGTVPGPATPRPADPSDPTSARKGNGIATSKPGPIQ